MDPCLFLSEKVICVVYVDDCIMFARDTADITAAIETLKCNGFELRRIIDTIGFQNASGKATPAKVSELPADVDSQSSQEHWSKAS
eukprot:337476-Ditylum_brightwellii.AAC.2